MLKWNKRYAFIITGLILISCASYYFVQKPGSNQCISDLDNDGTMEKLVLSGTQDKVYYKYLDIYSKEKQIMKIDLSKIKPWKVQTCDIDGDGKKEISIGVFKTARFHPVLAKRPFIYNWDEEGISPKWLGSRLSRPFEDYIFADLDLDGMDELIAIENLQKGTKLINSYKWKNFGFEAVAESSEYEDIMGLKAVTVQVKESSLQNLVRVRIKVNGRWKNTSFKYNKEEANLLDQGS